MECQACCSQLTALMDFELSPEQAGETEGHLASCPDCQSQYASLQRAATLIDQLPASNLQLPPWSAIQARVLPSARKVGTFRWDWLSPQKWAPVGAAAVALLVSLGLLIPAGIERLELAQALEEYVHQRTAEEALLETVWGLVDQRDLPNPFSLNQTQRVNPFLTE